ncbi:hypothetical protein L226DRAFT_528536 [Lentinus tigrinus ALCF2SS1-7]|uniref:uncharacterized protein n=1 Tax=Lentinus tigrinus ALCF2SS1-7 TaxID=1328758 RepID=UPI0011661EE3|nr:hypothetical protein L226DRAFT_528536 [Lentinus tigrinus ALCF2SS1-7]
MAGVWAKTRPELPVELYTHALGFLDPKDPSALKTLFSVLWTSTYLRTAASVSSIWKPYYESRYTQCVPENEARRHAQFGGNYFKLYMKRRELDHRALELVDGIRLEIPGRSARARVLAQELSFDVWDALRAETVLPVPKYFRSRHDKSTVDAAPHAFPRRYWARAVQGVIARYWAVRMWQRAVAGDPGVTFEEVLLGFSTFLGWSPYVLSQALDNIATSCRQTCLAQKIILDQANPEFDLAKACDTVIVQMHEEGWMGDDEEDMDEHLLDIYPHIPLMKSEEFSFALSAFSKVWLFVALCCRLGLDAYPTMTVSGTAPVYQSCVRPRDPAKLPVVVDFTTSPLIRPLNHTPIYQEVLRLSEGHFQPEMARMCMPELPANALFMVALNQAGQSLSLYKEEEHDDWLHFEKERLCTAIHAIQCARMLFPSIEAPTLIHHGQMWDTFPLDWQAIVLDVLLADAPLGSPRGGLAVEVGLSVRESEDLDKLIMRRSGDLRNKNIPDVGSVVAHSIRDNFPGFELDWKVSVDEQGEWSLYIRRVFADAFDDSGLMSEGSQLEPYVPKGVSKMFARSWSLQWSHFGRYVEDVSFEDADKDGQPTRLVMTAEIRTLYPEDRIPEAKPY